MHTCLQDETTADTLIFRTTCDSNLMLKSGRAAAQAQHQVQR